MIEKIAACIDRKLWAESGKVFYSGPDAFSGPAPVYVLGFNPGGDPVNHTRETMGTVGTHTNFVLSEAQADWSAYCDEIWKEWATRAGEAPLQRRMQHLLSALRLDPRRVPASNLIFTRSRRSARLGDTDALIEMCWPVHEAVLAMLRPKALICFGIATGKRVIKRLGVTRELDHFEEQYNRPKSRRWKSRAWETPGLIVFGLAHPSIADWTNTLADPTRMVERWIQTEALPRPGDVG